MNHNCVFGWFPFFFLPEVFQTGWFRDGFDPFKSQRITWSQGWSVDQSNLLKEYEGFNIENVKKPMQRSFSGGQEGGDFCPQTLRVSCMTVLLVL